MSRPKEQFQNHFIAPQVQIQEPVNRFVKDDNVLITILPLKIFVLDQMVADFLELSRQCWREIEESPWTMEQFYAEYPGKFKFSYYAQTHNSIVGCLIATTLQDHEAVLFDKTDKSIIYINKLAVLKTFRGGAISSQHHVAFAMFSSLLKNARANGYDVVRLSVSQSNERALAFYYRIGFSEIGERDDFSSSLNKMFIMEYNL